jgi:cell division protein FtsB
MRIGKNARKHGGKHRLGREPGLVARKLPKAPRRKRRLRLLLPVAVLIVMAFLYYRPLSSYLQTRDELGARRAQVVALRAEKVRLERRLARTTSDAALAREARRIGYVKPGERLFIVKGIAAWQRQHHATTP